MLHLSPVMNWVGISKEENVLADVIYQVFKKYDIVTIRAI